MSPFVEKISSKPSAVIVGLETPGLGLMRTLSRLGVKVTGVINNRDNRGRWTRFGRKVVCEYEDDEQLIETLITIGKQQGQQSALFLTSDHEVISVSRERDRLAPYFEMNLPSERVVHTLMDKRLFAEYALQKGLPIPKTFIADNLNEIQRISRSIRYPCVLKPSYRSLQWYEAALEKVFKVQGSEELIQAYLKVRPISCKLH